MVVIAMERHKMHGQNHNHRGIFSKTSTKIRVDGFVFLNKRELDRYKVLKNREALGEIVDLEVKKEFNLGYDEFGLMKALNGKPLRYFIDFVYTETQTKQKVYEEVKKHHDEFSNCKRQLLQWFNKISIKVV